jgi:CubicO group peptidase (beta-lactamase class C family)
MIRRDGPLTLVGGSARALWTAFVALAVVGAGGPDEPAAVAGRLDQYARAASALGFSGSLLVARGGRVILNKGYGWADGPGAVPNGPDTVFYLASFSKPFTAAAVLRLEARGKLKTTDTLAMRLRDVPPDKASITLHQLLTHTSGLPRYGWDEGTHDWRVTDRDGAVKGILGSKLATPPGKTFSYQNANYVLLAAVVESVSGMSFQSFVRQQLLRPAGVKTARFGWDTPPGREGPRDVALGHSDGSVVGSYLSRPRSWLRVGGGDMLMSVGDLYRWGLALRDGTLLPAAQRAKCFAIQTPVAPGFGYGYGWWVRQDGDGGKRVVFHGGDFSGYHLEFRWYPPTDTTLVVATNDEFHGASLAEPVLNHVGLIMQGKGSPLPPVKALSGAQLGRCVGRFVLPGGGWLDVRPKGTGLEIKAEEPSGADVLANGLPATATDRRADGRRALDLVGRLKKEDPAAFQDVLARELRPGAGEFRDEWQALRKRMGPLRSYQILSTVSPPNQAESMSYVRLNFTGGQTVMAYAWRQGQLRYTIPGARIEPGPVLFAPVADREFIAFDWRTGDILRAVFEADRHGRATSLKVQGRAGNMSQLNRADPPARQPG